MQDLRRRLIRRAIAAQGKSAPLLRLSVSAPTIGLMAHDAHDCSAVTLKKGLLYRHRCGPTVSLTVGETETSVALPQRRPARVSDVSPLTLKGAEALFAVECERVAKAMPEIADQGVEAVADEARARLAARAARRDRFVARAEIGQDPSLVGAQP